MITPLGPYSLTIVTEDNFLEVASKLREWPSFSLDCETTGLSPYAGARLFSFAIANESEVFYFNFNSIPDNLGNKAPVILPRKYIPTLKKFLDFDSVEFINHNIKFDLHFLAAEGLVFDKCSFFCTQVMARLINNHLPNYKLKTLAKLLGLFKDDTVEEYIKKHKLYREEDNKKKSRVKSPRFELVPFEIMAQYCGHDAWVTYQLSKYEKKRILDISLEQIALGVANINQVVETEKKVTRVLFEMEREGVLVDRDYTKKAFLYHCDKYERAAEEITTLTGIQFEDAPTVLKAIFEKLQIKSGTTEKGRDSYADDVLPDHSISELIRTYRKSYKSAHTYYENFLKLSEKDSKLHTDFKQAGTNTGRLSASNPNLQNCLGMGCEVLTKSGFKNYSEITTYDEAATYNIITNKIEFQKIDQIVFNEVDNFTYLKSDNIDIELTDEHRFLYFSRKGTPKIIDTKDIKEDYKVKSAGVYEGKSISLEVPLLKYLVAIQADSTSNRYSGRFFRFRKKRKAVRLREILTSLGIPYKETIIKRGDYSFSIDKRNEPKIIAKFIDENKFFTYEFLNLSLENRKIFLNELRFWDGLSTRKNLAYCSKYEKNVKVIQAVASITGMRTVINHLPNNSGRYYYYLYGVSRDYFYTTNINKKVSFKKASSWCITVRNSFILVRSNGRTLITGNCPKRGEENEDFKVRSCIKPEKDFFFFMPDFDQMEYRKLLDTAEETSVIEKVLGGLDVHTATAEDMNVDRFSAKTLNFMLLYGGGAQKLADTLGISLYEAKKKKALYFKTLSRVSALVDALIKTVEKRGHITNWYGRLLRLPPQGSYAIANHFIQGGCADIVKKAMVELWELLKDKKSKMLLQVHDEILFKIHYSEIDIIPEINRIMREAYPAKRLPLTCGFDYSLENWHDKQGAKCYEDLKHGLETYFQEMKVSP